MVHAQHRQPDPGRSVSRRRPPAGPGGLIIVDKPAGVTSHDVVAQVRRLVGTRRVGHAGTLDPMATGVLIIGIERATKLMTHLLLDNKTYLATMRLGVSTDTDDADGTVTATADASLLDLDTIARAMHERVGSVLQRPSDVSAIKVDGRRSYALVRAGIEVSLAERPVSVHRFDLVGSPSAVGAAMDVDVVVDCSSGTYVRALARDVGAALGVGGHLTALRRTRVGPFTLADAIGLAELAGCANPITLPLPAAIAATMPVRLLTEEQAQELTFGRTIDLGHIPGTYGGLAPDGHAVALLRDSAGRARPVLGFTPAGDR